MPRSNFREQGVGFRVQGSADFSTHPTGPGSMCLYTWSPQGSMSYSLNSLMGGGGL